MLKLFLISLLLLRKQNVSTVHHFVAWWIMTVTEQLAICQFVRWIGKRSLVIFIQSNKVRWQDSCCKSFDCLRQRTALLDLECHQVFKVNRISAVDIECKVNNRALLSCNAVMESTASWEYNEGKRNLSFSGWLTECKAYIQQIETTVPKQ